MKIKLSALKELIKEAVESTTEEFPSDGDTFMSLENGSVYPEDIVVGGDLSKATDEDLSGEYVFDSQGTGKIDGPQPGEPGVWFECDNGLGYNLPPGGLVRMPQYDRGGSKYWARAKDVAGIEAAVDANTPKTDIDKAMIKMLSNVTTYYVGLADIKHYQIRLRKDSIFFIHKDPDSVGLEGTILVDDVPKEVMNSALARRYGGLAAVGQWMFDHGAKKVKPQKRHIDRPYYD
jgi:hypothetical protein